MDEINKRRGDQHAEKTTDYTKDYNKLISLMVGCNYTWKPEPRNKRRKSTDKPDRTLIKLQSKSDRDWEKTKQATVKLIGGAKLTQIGKWPKEKPQNDNKSVGLGHIQRKWSKHIFISDPVSNNPEKIVISFLFKRLFGSFDP